MVLDGYPMTLKGEGSKAMAVTTIAAVVGGMVGSFTLLFLSPPLASLAIKFGPAQTFLTAMLGITIIVGLSKGAMLKGMISAAAGFLISTVGMDVISGGYRYTFDVLELFEGVPMIPTVIGLFCCAQVYSPAASKKAQIAILVIGLYGAKFFARITAIPNSVLIPLIAVFTVLGSYAIRNLLFDVFLMIGFGAIGFYMEKSRIPLAPFVLAFILGSIVEKQFRRALILVESGTSGVFTNWICLLLLALNILCLLTPFFDDIKKRLGKKKAA